MRNVHRFSHPVTGFQLRVFQSKGRKETVNRFMAPNYYTTSAQNGDLLVHNRTKAGDSVNNIIYKYQFIMMDTFGNVVDLFRGQARLFYYLRTNGYVYQGMERVRIDELSEFDTAVGSNIEFVETWEAYMSAPLIPEDFVADPEFKTAAVSDPDGIKLPTPKAETPVFNSVADELVGKHGVCGNERSPEGWECSRAQGHSGPCAAHHEELSQEDLKRYGRSLRVKPTFWQRVKAFFTR